MFYDRGNRPGFHIFIISSLARNVKYILTESVPVKLYGFAGAFCDPGMCREIAPQGHFLALRAQGATSACGLLAMTNLRTSRHRMCAAKIASLHGAPQLVKKVPLDFFDKLLSELQNQILQHDFAILPLRRVI